MFTVIGGVIFLLDYMVLKSMFNLGYNVLIERFWLYGVRVKTDWVY